MLKKRIIVCLDVRDGRVTKGVRFKNNVVVGDPVKLAEYYTREGADELVFYDITASAEHRSIMCDVVERVAKGVFIPFAVGGGVRSIADMDRLLNLGAEKISVNSLAVLHPEIITEGAKKFGRQCIVVAIDALADDRMPSGYRVVIRGGREPTEKDVLQWAKEAHYRGAGEIVLNSIDADGTNEGYDCLLTRLISTTLEIPIVASGGAGSPDHIVEVFEKGCADAALIASMVHYRHYRISEIKQHLHKKRANIRL